MLSFIAFILKLLFAAFLGGVLVYKPGRIKDETQIMYSAMIAIIAVTLISVSTLFPETAVGAITGASIFAIVIGIILLTRDMEFEVRLLFLFSSIIGIICGSGHIFYGIIFSIVIYIILHNGHRFFDKEKSSTKQDDNNSIENL